MRTGRMILAGVAAPALIVTALAQAGHVIPAACVPGGKNCQGLTATYSGTWSFTVANSSGGTRKLSVGWSEKFAADGTYPIGKSPGYWSLATDSGTTSFSGSAAPGDNCTGKLSLAPDAAALIRKDDQQYMAAVSDYDPATSKISRSHWYVAEEVPLLANEPSAYLRSSDPSASDWCGQGTVYQKVAAPDSEGQPWATSLAGKQCHINWGPAGSFSPTDVVAFPAAGGKQADDCSGHGTVSANGITLTWHAALKQTVTVTSGRHLEIIATIAGNRDTATGKSQTLAAGQRVTLEVKFSDGSEVNSPDWTQGIAGPEAIGSYDWVPHRGKVTAFEPADLKKKEFSFYWITAGSHHVAVTAKDAATGQSYQAMADFVVQEPVVSRFTASTCKVTVFRPDQGNDLLVFGGRRHCAGGNGIRWSYVVQAPAAAGGKVGFAQVLNVDLRHDGEACLIRTEKDGKVVNAYRADGSTEALDESFWYDHNDGVAAGATSPVLTQVDAPHTPLTGGGTWSEGFKASDWLMFLPAGPQSIPVAVRLMRWSYSGTARWTEDDPFSDGHHWELTDHGGSEERSLGSAKISATQPEWQRLFLGGEPTGCHA